MDALETLMAIALFGLPLLAAGVFAWAFFRGRVNLVGLVCDGRGANSPARWQLLFISVAAAISYLVEVARSDSGRALPDLPGWFTTVLIASNSVYLIRKGSAFGVFRSVIEKIVQLRRL